MTALNHHSRRRSVRNIRAAVAGLAMASLAGTLAACDPEGSEGGGADGVSVLAAFYPLQFVSERVAGEEATVTSLTPPGADPHSLELAPVQVADMAEADLVIYSSGLQPAVDDAVASQPPPRLVDAWDAAGIEADLLAEDPHFWLDPTLLGPVAGAVADELAAADPDNAEAYHDRADELSAELDELDQQYTDRLAGCSGAMLITAHEAFGYLADRYDLRQEGIAGIDPEVEASPARMREVADLVEEYGVQTLFFETITAPDVTEALAAEAGVSTAVLDPLESPPTEGDYFATMEANLEALENGLVCG
ncbi:metal ABC transporter substrate-binding protein [Ruania halotolerans]|uniref:metal ABC transporter substrate-binding protein n=1 Tax=Ruania halotolerans TaxID=2897773 RepID=UPI001E4E9EF9|nr:metal ABC transporter substrate-binding protein [Ruania halotolerans]UFU06031.1 metal ABC transporter substrate-binding protein [Ruania halotolerans]